MLRLTKRKIDKSESNPTILRVMEQKEFLGEISVTTKGIKFDSEIIHPYNKMHVSFGTKKKWMRKALESYLGIFKLKRELQETQEMLKETVQIMNQQLALVENQRDMAEAKYDALVSGKPFDLEAYQALKMVECA